MMKTHFWIIAVQFIGSASAACASSHETESAADRFIASMNATSTQHEGSHADGGALPTHTRICDGSDELRVRFLDIPHGGGELSGTALHSENGATSFAIDGKCRYWINNGWGTNSCAYAWRTGTIQPEFEDVLNEALDLAHLDSLNGCGADSAAEIRSALSRSACTFGELDPRFETARDLVWSNAALLFESGAPMAGSLHIAGEIASDDGAEFYDWPISEPISDYLIAPELTSEPGTSLLLDAGPDAEALRQLGAANCANEHALNPPHIRVRQGGTFARVILRDALPYEDEHGLWPFGD